MNVGGVARCVGAVSDSATFCATFRPLLRVVVLRVGGDLAGGCTNVLDFAAAVPRCRGKDSVAPMQFSAAGQHT